jgi:hypothetical protein
MAGETLADARTGKNERHPLIGLPRQSVFGRLAGYEDVNDAERLRHDPAMRRILGGKAAQGRAASSSQIQMPGKMTKSPSTTIPTTPGTGSRPQLASILREGRKSANIHLSSGVIWGIPERLAAPSPLGHTSASVEVLTVGGVR